MIMHTSISNDSSSSTSSTFSYHTKSIPASPVSSPTSVMSTNLIKKKTSSRRRVCFSTNIAAHQLIEERSELTDEEIGAVWYLDDDYRQMKKDLKVTLKKMSRCAPLDETLETSRGLEHKTKTGMKKRQNDRYMSIDIVLDEQEMQFEDGRRDPAYIAEMYKQSTAHCALNAHLVGKKDETNISNDPQVQALLQRHLDCKQRIRLPSTKLVQSVTPALLSNVPIKSPVVCAAA